MSHVIGHFSEKIDWCDYGSASMVSQRPNIDFGPRLFISSTIFQTAAKKANMIRAYTHVAAQMASSVEKWVMRMDMT